MPDGNMRRPKQLPEQILARKTAILGVGISAGDVTSIVDPTPTPGTDGGVEAPVLTPSPSDFIAPSTPTLSGTVQGIRVSWDGKNANGNPYPAGAFVEIHISTSGATFTPSSSTLAGRLLGSAGFFTIGALAAGTTYFVRLVGVDEAGNTTSPSTAASSQTGLTTTNDYGTGTITSGAVSFNARSIGGITTTVGTTAPSSPVTGDIWLDSTGGAITHKRWNGSSWVTQAFDSESISAGAITATQIAAGAITAGAIAANAITADKIDANAVTADKINAGAITADKIDANAVTADKISATAIDGKTISGASIRTASTGARVEIGNAFGFLGSVAFYRSGGTYSGEVIAGSTNGVTVQAGSGQDVNVNGSTVYLNGAVDCQSSLDVTGGESKLGFDSGSNAAGLRVASGGQVYSYGIDNNTSGSAANVRIGSSAQLLRSTSTVRFKDDLAPLTDDLADVPAEKVSGEPASVDPYDVLTLTPTEFRSLSPADGDARMLGFIAEDVAVKLPWAANWDDDGQPSAVEDRPILAALLYVVRQQHEQIADLTTRLEALEA